MLSKEIEQSTFNQQILLSLYHNSKNIPHSEQYSELNRFRKQVEIEKSGPHHNPYQAHQRHVYTYRLIFLGLGILFFLLTALIYQHSINWTSYIVVFSNFHTAKIVICSLCLLLGFSAIGIGMTLRVEKEAAHQLLRRAKRKLHRIYNRHQTASFFSWGEELKRYRALRHSYLSAKEKISESKEVAHLLFRQIAESPGMNNQERIRLYNQAILELNDGLHHIINAFQKKQKNLT